MTETKGGSLRDKPASDGDRETLHKELLTIHREADKAVGRLAKHHLERLQCHRGCHDCCVDGISVHVVEAERIRRNHAELLASGEPHPAGACAFLDDSGACRIYRDRPYVCRTEGLPLRWFAESLQGEMVEHRDICPLNDRGLPITGLDADECWLIGPFEDRLAQLQARTAEGRGLRVPLRSLFEKP